MAPTPKRGLGRGFESLLSPDFDKAKLLASSDDRIEHVTISKLKTNPYQPRRNFEEKALHELADSIKHYGIVQPLVVMPEENGFYVLIAGERRWRAAEIAGLRSVPAIVRSSKNLEQLEVALIENVQRVDLDPIEQAISIERLHDQFSVSYDIIATRLSKAPSTVVNIVRLLQLPEDAREALNKHEISEGHARAILALKDKPEHQKQLLEATMKNGWSVRQAERYVTGVKEGAKDQEQAHARVSTETPLTKQLGKKLKTTVHIKRTARGGALEISFKSDQELERIIAALQK
jgi:ParB family chromosome partitioning protein